MNTTVPTLDEYLNKYFSIKQQKDNDFTFIYLAYRFSIEAYLDLDETKDFKSFCIQNNSFLTWAKHFTVALSDVVQIKTRFNPFRMQNFSEETIERKAEIQRKNLELTNAIRLNQDFANIQRDLYDFFKANIQNAEDIKGLAEIYGYWMIYIMNPSLSDDEIVMHPDLVRNIGIQIISSSEKWLEGEGYSDN